MHAIPGEDWDRYYGDVIQTEGGTDRAAFYYGQADMCQGEGFGPKR